MRSRPVCWLVPGVGRRLNHFLWMSSRGQWFNIKTFMLGLLTGFTCLYKVSLEGGDVQLAIAGLAGNRGIRS